MRVAFWNINLGTGSFSDKVKTLSTWCEALPQDLLFLEEVSFTQTANGWQELVQNTGMTPLNNVATLDVNGNASTKQLAALVGPHCPVELVATPLRLAGLTSIRMGLKVVFKSGGGPQIYGIHANASQSGGKAATDSATDLVNAGANVVVGGDFNFDSRKVAGAVVSLDYRRVPLAVSQWNRQGSAIDQDEQKKDFGFQTKFVQATLQPSSNGVIDYVVHGSGVTVTPVVNCPTEELWRDIVAQFDHAPVCYEITVP